MRKQGLLKDGRVRSAIYELRQKLGEEVSLIETERSRKGDELGYHLAEGTKVQFRFPDGETVSVE
ncbi:MAG: hypothetical protein DRP63_09075 [Planctomycetota bacterium]|nr:MAG: hypothetical protein DRP63_09075 [Planctomycetota bacterium]